MPFPFDSQTFQKQLSSDKLVSEQLLLLLEQEQQALSDRDADQVDQLLEKKVPLLEQLEQSSKIRQHWAQQMGNSSDEQAWNKIVEQLGGETISKQWHELKSLFAKVQKQNEINGKLLSRHQKTVSRLLDLMRGKTAAPNLYNASGYSSAQAHSNNIGQA
ncbi:flagella synthesis protein FlgN [Agaribacterium haliotis]|uniref:flagella synthesis protein FlgN n=1 Tax=Agaribacterium haliotis TaxID=2013869 RepID=UPI000BB54D61|nr:flagellar protein FlgN [Agaribacterium haliotis]